MRPFAAMMAAACLSLPAGILAQGADAPMTSLAERLFSHLEDAVYIAPGRGLGRVAIGAPLSSVVDAWGAPLRSDRSGIFNRRTTLLYEAGVNAWIRVRGDKRVEEIGIQGRTRFATTEGARFGMPNHQVALIYGEPVTTESGDYRYPQRGIAFVFRAGTVYQIEVFAPREKEP